MGETILCIINCLSLVSEHDRTFRRAWGRISITCQQTPGGTRKAEKAAEVGTAARGPKASTLAAVSVQIGRFMDPGLALVLLRSSDSGWFSGLHMCLVEAIQHI